MVSYLVLACGTDASHRRTEWSVKSIERYTGISRGRARNALDRLKEAKLIEEQKGAARYGASAYYLVEPEKVGDEEPERIWLPNAIVTGAEDETPPIELLRASPSVLRLFIDLYSCQNLVEHGGVCAHNIWQPFTKSRLGEHGIFIVWGFESGTETARPVRDRSS